MIVHFRKFLCLARNVIEITPRTSMFSVIAKLTKQIKVITLNDAMKECNFE